MSRRNSHRSGFACLDLIFFVQSCGVVCAMYVTGGGAIDGAQNRGDQQVFCGGGETGNSRLARVYSVRSSQPSFRLGGMSQSTAR